VRKWQNVLMSGWKHCFVQTHALCLEPLKTDVPSAKMTKRADLWLKRQFCTNACILLTIVKKWQNVLISGWKRSFGQTHELCWKSLMNPPMSGLPIKSRQTHNCQSVSYLLRKTDPSRCVQMYLSQMKKKTANSAYDEHVFFCFRTGRTTF